METLSDKIVKLTDKEGEDNWIGCVLRKDIKEFIVRDTELIMKHFPMNANMIALMSDRAELIGDELK